MLSHPFGRGTTAIVRALVATLICFTVVFASAPAKADQSIIKFPGDHPDYFFEAEPHLLVAPFDKFEFGAGFRGTIEIVDNGFIKTINNTVGIGFGADFTFEERIWIPVVMQWNFWLSRNWSVFGEPGGALRIKNGKVDPDWTAYLGGRFHFTEYITLTMRIGYPMASVGVSFLL
jgi:hypothetical protein